MHIQAVNVVFVQVILMLLFNAWGCGMSQLAQHLHYASDGVISCNV